MFCVKSWGTRKLYHVQEHSFGYLLVFFIDFRQKLKFLAYFEIRDGKVPLQSQNPKKKTITKSQRRKSEISQKVAKQVKSSKAGG